MSLKNKFGALALAVLVVIAAFGLSTQQTRANTLSVTSSATNFVSGGNVVIASTFDNDEQAFSIAAVGGTGPSLTFQNCTYDADSGGALTDEVVGNCNSGAGDDSGTPTDATFAYTAARAALIDTGVNAAAQRFRIDLVLTATCTTPTVITVTATQNAVAVSTAVICGVAPVGTVNTITINKVDQLGNRLSATFSIQILTGTGIWTEVGRAITGPSTTATNTPVGNPCVIPSTDPCWTYTAANPATLAAGTYRVIETPSIGTGVLCTLVNINVGTFPGTAPSGTPANPTLTAGVATVVLPAVTTESIFTFVNSCPQAGSPSSATSSVVVVYGGSTQNVDTTHVEIVPAPYNDNDARLDIRIRDANSIPINLAHVTVYIDQGALWMRQDTSGLSFIGYEVIEPANAGFGTNLQGDDCENYNGVGVNVNNANFPFSNQLPYNPASPLIQDGFTNSNGIISACVGVDPNLVSGVKPGKINVTIIVEQATTFFPAAANLVLTTSIVVVGPPAKIDVTASPTSVNCGQQVTIVAKITDSAGQNVSDHTPVEAVTNYGGVLGGTGAVIGFAGPVAPLSSTVAETFGGAVTIYLLTANSEAGPYQVIITAGGAAVVSSFNSGGAFYGQFNGYGTGNLLGLTSSAPISQTVSVSCSGPAPAASAPAAAAPVTPPRTGQGITPPNTGDAGLAATSGGSSWVLFAVVGMVAFSLAGVASVKFARR